MNFKNYIKKLVFPHTYSPEAYVNFLRNRGCTIGQNTYFFNPRNTRIDTSRPEFIEIGDNCKIAEGAVILAHDYSYSILRNIHHEMLPTSAVTKIGNNVFIGMNSIILMGSVIGDNVIIGAGSVVHGHVPSNTIFAGNPAKQISTMNKYYEKLKSNVVNNAKLHAKRIIDVKGRKPTIREMGYYSWIFTEGTPDTSALTFLGDCRDEAIIDYNNLKNVYSSFDEFLQDLDN